MTGWALGTWHLEIRQARRGGAHGGGHSSHIFAGPMGAAPPLGLPPSFVSFRSAWAPPPAPPPAEDEATQRFMSALSFGAGGLILLSLSLCAACFLMTEMRRRASKGGSGGRPVNMPSFSNGLRYAAVGGGSVAGSSATGMSSRLSSAIARPLQSEVHPYAVHPSRLFGSDGLEGGLGGGLEEGDEDGWEDEEGAQEVPVLLQTSGLLQTKTVALDLCRECADLLDLTNLLADLFPAVLRDRRSQRDVLLFCRESAGKDEEGWLRVTEDSDLDAVLGCPALRLMPRNRQQRRSSHRLAYVTPYPQPHRARPGGGSAGGRGGGWRRAKADVDPVAEATAAALRATAGEDAAGEGAPGWDLPAEERTAEPETLSEIMGIRRGAARRPPPKRAEGQWNGLD